MYGGTKAVYRLLSAYEDYSGKITIGTSYQDMVSPSGVVGFIEDADQYIDSILSSSISSLPVSPTPGGLTFASNRYAAFFIVHSLWTSNKMSGDMPIACLEWRDLAEKSLNSYVRSQTEGGRETPRYTDPGMIFTERGVAGVDYQNISGVAKDEDTTNKG